MKSKEAVLLLFVFFLALLVGRKVTDLEKEVKTLKGQTEAILEAGRIATPALKYWVCVGVPSVNNNDGTIGVALRNAGDLQTEFKVIKFPHRHAQKRYIMELADGYRIYFKILDSDQLRVENLTNPGDYLGIREIFLPDGVTRVM